MVRCSACGFESLGAMRFCGMCGAPLLRTCPACGYANPGGFRFCGMCGTGLDKAASASPPDAETLPDIEVPPAVLAPPVSPPARHTARLASPGLARVSGALSVPSLMVGERRIATILMADVQGSTELLERVGTEAWVDMMNRVFHILEAEIYRFGGKVDQFRGDGLLAFFGANVAHEDDPERAVLAALSMQAALRPYAAALAREEGIDLRLRVGVNTGDVIVTSVGNRQQHSEDTAMGEAISIASRMETSAEPGTVLASEATYRLTTSLFEWEALGAIRVKGVARSISVYRPLTWRPDAELLRVQSLSLPLIGRDHEFDTLKHCVKGLYDGRGGIAFVMGDKGMGKSFVVREVRHHFAREGALRAGAQEDGARPQSILWLRGRCRSYDRSRPHAMWVDLLFNWLGAQPDQPREELTRRLWERLDVLCPDQSETWYAYLATLLGLPLEPRLADHVAALDAEILRQHCFAAIQTWVETLAQRQPLVVELSDIHWIDDAALDLLMHCMPLSETEAVLWICTFLPDRSSPAWQFRFRVETDFPHRLQMLNLAPLNEDECIEFVENLVGSEVLPTAAVMLVVDKAEGNPYYLRELVRVLMSDGTLVLDGGSGKWSVTRPVTSLDLPSSLQTLLLSRVDQLPRTQRRILQMASVVGTVFWYDVVQHLVETVLSEEVDDTALLSHLTELERAQLIYERGRGHTLGREYAFQSNLMRDVVYESLLTAQRLSYHKITAEYAEQRFSGDELLSYAGVLAYHYNRAGDSMKELHYVLELAEQARRIYANPKAIAHLTYALALLDELESHSSGREARQTLLQERFRILCIRRDLYTLTGDFKAMRADGEALLPIAEELSAEPVWTIDALLNHPFVNNWRNQEEVTRGLAMMQRALDLARQLGDRRREMYCCGALAGLKYAAKDPLWMELGENALKIAQELDDKGYQIGLLSGIGGVFASSDPERSLAYLEMALPISQSLNDKRAELDLLNLIATQLENSGDYHRRIVECHEKQLAIARAIGDRMTESRALMFIAQIQGVYLGDLDGALELLEEAHQLLKTSDAAVFVRLRIAQVQALKGLLLEAEAILEEVRPYAQNFIHDIARVGFDLVSAILSLAMGDETHLRRMLEILPATREISVDHDTMIEYKVGSLAAQYRMVTDSKLAAVHLALAELLVETTEVQQHVQLALEASQRAVEAFEAAGFVRPVESSSQELLYIHSQALGANGQDEAAQRYLRRAYEALMSKYSQLPENSRFRRMFLEAVPVNREIYVRYSASAMRVKWDGARVSVEFHDQLNTRG
ncbi:MAG: AAA family ATPase [Anaerolineae bacterium]|nr:AAA family ATPase [Anaerolineae bacterium]